MGGPPFNSRQVVLVHDFVRLIVENFCGALPRRRYESVRTRLRRVSGVVPGGNENDNENENEEEDEQSPQPHLIEPGVNNFSGKRLQLFGVSFRSGHPHRNTSSSPWAWWRGYG